MRQDLRDYQELLIARNSVESRHFTRSLRIRCPPALPAALKVAAARQLMTVSEYVRRAIIKQLKADGIDPAQFKETN